MTNIHLLLHVRPGFEEDLIHELSTHLTAFGLKDSTIHGSENSGFTHVQIPVEKFELVRKKLQWSQLVFARQILWSTGPIQLPKEGDRVTSLINAIQQELLPLSSANAFSSFDYETPDTDEAKELNSFCKSLSRPTENALNKLKVLPKGKGAAHLPRLCLFMVTPEEVWPAFSDVSNSSPWPMGIPRLKFPPQAPSRSTLKLEEAFITFLGHTEMDERLKNGMTAVDLGASPGGWTYQLVKRGMHVTAIDNGNMDSSLMETAYVEHIREDAFTYRPGLPVDWLVCDVVEQPARIAELMTQWLINGWCREAIFNLKLPMKKRWEETKSCLDHLESSCKKSGLKIAIQCKQLYHDRKEVTVHVRKM